MPDARLPGDVRPRPGGEVDVAAAIPARWASSRLPGKPLLPLAGKPLIQHVWERVRRAAGLSRVVVLTDDERIAEAVEGFGGEHEMTPTECVSGTDRIAWAARHWNAQAVVNVQGDEPLVAVEAVTLLARHLASHPEDPMVTLAVPASDADLDDPNAVKVVHDHAGLALYFSRAPIPYRRHQAGARALRHVGLYGYHREALLRLAALPPSPLELAEGLEQLRALEHGIAIRVLEAAAAAPGVDTPEDLARAERLLEQEAQGAARVTAAGGEPHRHRTHCGDAQGAETGTRAGKVE
jgi:3-deoxy-manno-octulosonate cytidylyltransferase (CMP-KDO synthetase)